MPWLNFRIWVVGLPVVAKGLNMSDFLQLSSSFVLATFPTKFQNQFLWRLKPYNNHIQFLFLLFFFFRKTFSTCRQLTFRVGKLVSWPFFCSNKKISSGARSFGRTSTKKKRCLQEKTFWLLVVILRDQTPLSALDSLAVKEEPKKASLLTCYTRTWIIIGWKILTSQKSFPSSGAQTLFSRRVKQESKKSFALAS